MSTYTHTHRIYASSRTHAQFHRQATPERINKSSEPIYSCTPPERDFDIYVYIFMYNIYIYIYIYIMRYVPSLIRIGSFMFKYTHTYTKYTHIYIGTHMNFETQVCCMHAYMHARIRVYIVSNTCIIF